MAISHPRSGDPFMNCLLRTAAFNAVLFLTLLAGCSRGPADIAGRWQGKITLPATGKSLTDLEVTLTRTGKSVSGTMNFTKVPNGLLPVSGVLDGEKLMLNSEVKSGLRVTYAGTVENSRLIKGTAILDYNVPQLGTNQDHTLLELSR
jgi:hypothetical protein